jgi:hypothetical protein
LTKQDERVLRAGDGREHALIGGHGARYPEPRLEADLLPACVVWDPTGNAAFLSFSELLSRLLLGSDRNQAAAVSALAQALSASNGLQSWAAACASQRFCNSQALASALSRYGRLLTVGVV